MVKQGFLLLQNMSICSFWVTVKHLLPPVKLFALSIPTDGWAQFP